jgi:non-specific serine/threonine protein kinase
MGTEVSEIKHLSGIEPLTEREEGILRLLADGLTNREIADRLFLSPETVKWYNKQIFGKLGVSNRTQAAAKAQEFDLQGDQHSASGNRTSNLKHNLPAPLTSFVGRQRELDEIITLLEASRLLTLTGPAGTGKTRLALQVAAQVAAEFADGVYLVELAPLKDSALVAGTVANTLGVKEIKRVPIAERLKDHLRNRTLLLLLDNFEHVVESAPLAEELLSTSQELKVMVTSREALGLYGEQEYPVAPLALPELNRPEQPETLVQNEAVSLFVERARATKPYFNLTGENASAVAEICVRLDGLPLAIELAAARIRMFGPDMLLEQLESSLLAFEGRLQGQPPRHGTLTSAIAWSYDLLDDPEKLLFARLSVYRGGCSIQAAKEICAHILSIEILDGLESLLRKNLLRQIEGSGGELRFDMLETIHEYASDQLDQIGETSELQSRHAEYYAALVEQLRSASRGGPDQLRRLNQLETEHDNIRGALEWSLGSGDPIDGLRLVGSLGHFWFRKGHYAEAQRWTSVALDRSKELDAPPAVRAALLHSAGVVAHFSDERDRGRQLHLEALGLYRGLDDDLETGWLLIYLGAQAFGQSDQYEEATAYVEEGLVLLQRVNDQAGIAQAMHIMGELARHDGNQEKAVEVLTEGLSIAREIGDALREILILDSLTYMAIYHDDVKKAATLSHEAFTRTIEADHQPHIPAAIAAAAAVSMAEGDPDRAARLLGASHAVFEARGFTPRPSDMPDISRSMLVVKKGQDSASFEAAFAEGQAMSVEDAIDYALANSS